MTGPGVGVGVFHGEPLNGSWSRSPIKTVFEYELTAADLESVDPEARH